jgi:spore germination cell wall hydrolase CwlJ-like protein
MSELMCLALTVYMEARQEPVRGQLAVAQVVLNRVRDERYPDTVCAVVEQGSPPGDALPRRADCQFSWRCDGKPDKPYEPVAWYRALRVAQYALAGARLPELEGVLHYHADYVAPRWAARLQHVIHIGSHVFYVEQLP